MEIYEITGFRTGVDQAGVNYLQPSDAFQYMRNGYIYRQVLQSRQGIGYFAPRLAGETRILGIFEYESPNSDTELLAFDTNQLYKYNVGTGIFDPIPFAGSLAAYGGFAISSNEFYISGTSYPSKTNTGRFVFTGKGIALNGTSAVFFYDGTSVLDYTSVADNPDYVAPPQGALNRASYVLYFNERINFIYPVIASVEYPQGVLYSGIRNSGGSGDSFATAGAGLFQADTSQVVTGASKMGQLMILNFQRSAYVLEKTRDAFNPYFGRLVPGVLGTNASYSAVKWDNSVKSVGKTGILETDGRQNLRTDNKIPYFTEDEIDQQQFELTYGGFDRQNNQFLWSYVESESESSTQNAILVNNYEEDSWSVYDLRVSVFGQTDIGLNLTWDDINETSGNESWAQWDTTEEIWDKIGLGEDVQKTLVGDNLGYIYQINQDFDDYTADISAITSGTTTTLTVNPTGILAGDVIAVYNVEGMTQINNYFPDINLSTGEFYTVLSATPTSIEINVDSTLFDAYTTGGQISKPIEFEAITIPFNPWRSAGRRVYVHSLEFLIDINGGFIHVDVYDNMRTTPFKSSILAKPDQEPKEASWVSMSVDQEANFITLGIRQSSPGVQIKLTSIRIHCSPGGYTSG